ncbi:nuclear transport factor 2 family protein [Acrocarpospora sp. B8E8]
MYTAFNSRNIDELLAIMSPEVDWPDVTGSPA